MDEVGQMVRLRDALLWFTGAQWREVILPSKGSRKFCAETSCFAAFRQTAPDEGV